MKVAGKEGDISQETLSSWDEHSHELMRGYEPRNAWNMDETGQFFRALPNKSLSQASGNCTGGKRSKERLTCAFFVNASGDKEKPIIIGKSANPRCFRGVSDSATLPCEYFSQPKALMESDILTEILRKLNGRLRREKRTIVLLMDNAPCHPEDLNDKFSQIKIVFFCLKTPHLVCSLVTLG